MMEGGVEHEEMLVETFYHPWKHTMYGEGCDRGPQDRWEHRTVNFYKKAHSLIKEAVPNVANMIHAQGQTGVTSAKTDIFVCGADDSDGRCVILANLSVKMAGGSILSSAGGKGTGNILQNIYRSSKGKAPEANTLPYLLESKVPQYVDEDEYDEWRADEGDPVMAQLRNWLWDNTLRVPFLVELLSGEQQYRDNTRAIATHLFCAGHEMRLWVKSQHHVGGYCVPITDELAQSMWGHVRVRLFNKGLHRGDPRRRPSIAIDLKRNWCPTV